MTVSSNYSFSLNREQIIQQGLFLAGLSGMTLDSTKLDRASDALNLELKALQREVSIVLTTVEEVAIPVVSGQAWVLMPADTLDVLEPVRYVRPGTVLELPVSAVTRDVYDRQPDKTVTGIPLQLYVQKHLDVTLYMWPCPVDSGTLKFARERLLRDLDGGTTPDLQVGWQKALAWKAAHVFGCAFNLPLERVAYLDKQARNAVELMREDDTERGDCQFYLERM